MDNGNNLVSIRRMHIWQGDSPTKAFFDILISNTFIVKGFKIVHGKNGLFMSMPQEKDKNGKFVPTFWTDDKAAQGFLQEIALEYYNNQIKKTGTQCPF